ncbi:MAG TPA: glycerophosphoryl diester phosphodiesterase membrane domain-containing protein, partial [Gaiellaceae bacterium]|nr:glycerophosphoryl diester phosphodiesterase membrane domain-containing protein [Gaiellaceae bacterium]
MTIGSVLDEAWTLYTKHFVRLFLIAFAVYVVLNLLSALLGVSLDDEGLGVVLFALLNAAISIIGYFWVQGALVEAAADIHDGKQDLEFGETFARVRPLLPALIVAGILAGLGIGVGLILLLVPGLYLLTRWALIVPVIVLEKRRAGESFGRSHELVRGHGWTIFGLVLVVFLLGAIASGIISGILRAALNDFLGFWIGNTVANAIVTPFFAVAL